MTDRYKVCASIERCNDEDDLAQDEYDTACIAVFDTACEAEVLLNQLQTQGAIPRDAICGGCYRPMEAHPASATYYLPCPSESPAERQFSVLPIIDTTKDGWFEDELRRRAGLTAVGRRMLSLWGDLVHNCEWDGYDDDPDDSGTYTISVKAMLRLERDLMIGIVGDRDGMRVELAEAR